MSSKRNEVFSHKVLEKVYGLTFKACTTKRPRSATTTAQSSSVAIKIHSSCVADVSPGVDTSSTKPSVCTCTGDTENKNRNKPTSAKVYGAVGPPKQATGSSCIAGGPSSTAAGPSSTTAGPSSTAAGPSSTAAGPSSTAGGPSSTTTGPSSTTTGPSSTTMGPSSMTEGSSFTAESIPLTDSECGHLLLTQEAACTVAKLTKNQKRKLKKRRRRERLKISPDRSKQFVYSGATDVEKTAKPKECQAKFVSFLEGIWDLYCKQELQGHDDKIEQFNGLVVDVRQANSHTTDSLVTLQTVMSLGVRARVEQTMDTLMSSDLNKDSMEMLLVLSRYWMDKVVSEMLPLPR